MEFAPVYLGPTFGAAEIGILLAAIFTGSATLQTWNYFRSFSNDPMYLKYLVGFVYSVDSIHTTLLAWILYHYSIASFGNNEAIRQLTSVWPAQTLVEGVTTFTAQTFYCFRVYRVTGNRTLALACFLIVFLRLCSNAWLAATVLTDISLYSLFDLGRVTPAPVVTSITLETLADVLIAACISVGVLRMRSGLRKSNMTVEKIVTFTMVSGLLTSVLAIAQLVSYLAMRNLIFITFYIVTSKVYANSLLASLNERQYLREIWNGTDTFWNGTFSTRLTLQIQPTSMRIEFSQCVTGGSGDLDRELGEIEDSHSRDRASTVIMKDLNCVPK